MQCGSASATGQPFRLVLLDVMMPGMDGFETAERMREVADFDQATVIMLSSADRSEDKQRAARMGVARCLTKPVTQSQLFNAIAQSLGTAVAEARPFDSIHSDRPGDFVPQTHPVGRGWHRESKGRHRSFDEARPPRYARQQWTGGVVGARQTGFRSGV